MTTRIQPRHAIALVLGLVLTLILVADARPPERFKKVTFKSGDGVQITADLYNVKGKGARNRPFVLLCHMAGSSRGEYRSIAPRLGTFGFHCLAVDLRSGSGSNDAAGGVSNETAKDAADKGKGQAYADALPDIEASVDWVRDQGYRGPLILVGSSYSSSLALVYAGRHEEKIQGVVSLSPAEYLQTIRVKPHASRIKKLPVYITSAGGQETAPARALFDSVPSPAKVFYDPEKGAHGSRTLGDRVDKNNRAKNWESILGFFKQFQGKKKSRKKSP